MKPLLCVTRANVVESVHTGYLCVTDSDGNEVFSVNTCKSPVYLRSTAKPLQALAFVISGAMERWRVLRKN